MPVPVPVPVPALMFVLMPVLVLVCEEAGTAAGQDEVAGAGTEETTAAEEEAVGKGAANAGPG